MAGSSFVGKMAGSTDTIMAAAVEASSHVVVCVSRGYKNSANCEQEAAYARQFEKKRKLKIIYLMMQSDFTTVSQPDSVDGWLGIMVGNSLWWAPVIFPRQVVLFTSHLFSGTRRGTWMNSMMSVRKYPTLSRLIFSTVL